MARSISVKIPTAVLISNIEARLAQIDEEVANYPASLEKYERELEDYKKSIAKKVSDFLKNNADKVGYDHDSVVRISTNYANKLELLIDSELARLPIRPVAPERPNQNRHYGNSYTNQKDLLEKNLRILRMTSQEEVNASTYGAIMEVL
jgi:hypothetical protein